MDEIYDADLERLLTIRRGRVHAFPDLASERTAIVVLDAVASVIDDQPAVAAAIDTLTTNGRMAGATICWIKPTPPGSWRAGEAARALMGDGALAEAAARMEPGAVDGAIAASLNPDPTDWMAHKAGHSAFYPGNSSLPDWLAAHRLDTVVLAGSAVAVIASAHDAFEAGFRVVVCRDATVGIEPAVLRDLARDRADIRRAAEVAALLAG